MDRRLKVNKFAFLCKSDVLTMNACKKVFNFVFVKLGDKILKPLLEYCRVPKEKQEYQEQQENRACLDFQGSM